MAYNNITLKRVKKMDKCGICGKSGENVSLLYGTHRSLGKIWLCTECWKNEFKKILPSGGSSGGCC
ncbi:MAG: hypothetical protein QXR19_13415 [Candidatus Jordarchaeaceae archaeon]